MRIRTCIKTIARQRGMTMTELARRMGWHLSNLSALDAGARSVSLHALTRLAQLLGCSPLDLLEVAGADEHPPFRGRTLSQRLQERDLGTPDGVERGWVHAAQLAWQRHYGRLKSRP